jgi:hypothetical protein
MVHGIYSCYAKWYQPPQFPKAPLFWDNYARKRGFISITPNYDYLINDTSNTWIHASRVVTDHIETTLNMLTLDIETPNHTPIYPPWVYIGHSQGGLIARTLTASGRYQTALTDALRKIYLLGTPNSGAVTEAGAGVFACTPYLNQSSMQSLFNCVYPDFGGKDVTAIAGTHCLGCKNKPGNNDTIVPVGSVSNIEYGNCITGGMSPLTLPHLEYFYTHFELGSPESREILSNRILPQSQRLVQ